MSRWTFDARDNARDRTQPVVIETEDGEEVELPTRWEVCGLCDGRGSHVNPSIDAHGLTREDFEDDPDFEEDYRAGVYDVACYQCGGRTTVRVVDESAMSPELRARWRAWERAEAECRAIEAAERRMGA